MVASTSFIWMDGELVPWDSANVHVLTHTLHYGVGVFEGIRAYRQADGRSAVFRLSEHVRRLYDSARLMLIRIPYEQPEIEQAILHTLRHNDLKEAYIRPIAFIGTGRMGLYAFDNPIRVSIACWHWGAYLGDEGLQKGIRAVVSSYTRHYPGSTLAKGKVCGHYVNSILAKRQAVQDGYDEAIMLDADGRVSEATGENIFIVAGGVIRTPEFASSILGGITRDAVIRIAGDLGYSVLECPISRDELYLADEVFLTGTAAEVTPVREVDHRTVGKGEPGPVTRAIQDRYFDVIKGRFDGYPEWRTYV